MEPRKTVSEPELQDPETVQYRVPSLSGSVASSINLPPSPSPSTQPIPLPKEIASAKRSSSFVIGHRSPPPSHSNSHSSYSSPSFHPSPVPTRTTSHTARDYGQQCHLNIGIDFGTTYSGVAWAILGDRGTSDVGAVETWPNAPASAVKVPTKIWYKPGGAIEWGYSVPPESDALTWFKLLLLKTDELPQKIRRSKDLKSARDLLAKVKKPLITVISDYLKKIWEFAVAEIRVQVGSSVDGMPFRVIMTVPANWPRHAQDEMRQAASQAGILNRRMGGLETKLELVGEPEAAAIAAFYDESLSRRSLRVGDIVTICDAGGGTADIVTYQIEKLHPAVHIVECAISGDADLCGAMFLDSQYKQYIEGMIGENKIKKFSAHVQSTLMSNWELNIKRSFQNSTPEIVVSIPHEIAKAIKSPTNILRNRQASKLVVGDTLRVSAVDIKKMFDPVLEDVLTLIHKQVKATMEKKHKKPKSILLVGGLGSNTFLRERLGAEYSAGDIELIQPKGAKPWSSICRGAAIKGMTQDEYDDQVIPVVTSYISKSHYGIVYKVPFDASKHQEEDRKYDNATKQHLAFNQMQWYVSKGEDINRGHPVTLSWERFHPDNRPIRSFPLKIYECESPTAPTRLTGEVSECQTIDFPVDWDSLAVTVGANGEKFRRVQFELKMTLLGLGKLDFATYINGDLVGQQTVSARLADADMLSR